MSDRAITGRDVIGDTVVERRIVPAPLRREKLPQISHDTDWRTAIGWLARAFERFQQAVEDATRNSRMVPLSANGMHETEEISFTSGTDKIVPHALGRPYRGVLFLAAVPPSTAAAAGYEVANSTDAVVKAELDKVQVTIHPTATFTGRLWIF